jgi:serine/threonine protein kinase
LHPRAKFPTRSKFVGGGEGFVRFVFFWRVDTKIQDQRNAPYKTTSAWHALLDLSRAPPQVKTSDTASASIASASTVKEIVWPSGAKVLKWPDDPLEWPDDPETDSLQVSTIPGFGASMWKFSSFRRKFMLFKKVSNHGTDGTVYEAGNRMTDEQVAVKIVKPKKGESELDTSSEALWLLHCQSENVVRLVDAFSSATFCAMAMEFLPSTLHQLCPYSSLTIKERLLSASEIMAVGTAMFTALSYVHSKHIVHRDLHPNNIMVPCENEVVVHRRAKLCDFGRATRVHGDVAEFASYYYPWPYKPPELVWTKGTRWQDLIPKYPSQVTLQWFKCDTWAMGMVLLEARWGQRWLFGDLTQKQSQVQNDVDPLINFSRVFGISREYFMNTANKSTNLWSVPSGAASWKSQEPFVQWISDKWLVKSLILDPEARKSPRHILDMMVSQSPG